MFPRYCSSKTLILFMAASCGLYFLTIGGWKLCIYRDHEFRYGWSKLFTLKSSRLPALLVLQLAEGLAVIFYQFRHHFIYRLQLVNL